MSLSQELTALGQMTVQDLRLRYAEVFDETTRSRNKAFLIKRILWRLQAIAEGGLSERALRQADVIANDADLRLIAPAAKTIGMPTPPASRLPLPGSILTRRYKDRTIAVSVLPMGFEYNGATYKSLSAVAKAITGTHWNGYHFFNLRKHHD